MAFTITSPFGQQLFTNLGPWQTDDLARYCQAIGVMIDPVAALVAEQGSDGDARYVPTWGLLFDVDQCPTGQLGYLGQYVGVPIPVGTPDATARALIRAKTGQARGTPAALVGVARAYLSGTPFTATATIGSATLTAVSSFTNLYGGGATALTGTAIPAATTITSTNPGAGTLVMSSPATATGTITVTAKTVFLEERVNGDAYQLRVATLSSETRSYAQAKTTYATYNDARGAVATYSAAGAYGTTAVLAALATVKPAGILLTYETLVGTDYRSARDTHATYTTARATWATYNAARANPTQQ